MFNNYAHFKGSKSNFNFDLELEFPSSGITGIFGPSGSGKTTLLRSLAGFDRHDYKLAKLVINGNIWHDQNIFIPTHKRAVGYVFQEVSLFEHLNTIGNIKFGFDRTRNPDSKLLDQTIEILGLGNYLKRNVDLLSGGEKQRVGIARAIAVNPEVLLMDEPLASLDFELKNEIMPYLQTIQEELRIPILYVTHSIDEVIQLADYLVVIKNGRVIDRGDLISVFPHIQDLINMGSKTSVVLESRVDDKDLKWHLAKLVFDGGHIWVKDQGWLIGQKRRVRILAQDVSLALEQQLSSIQNIIEVMVLEIKEDIDHPASVLVWLKPCKMVDKQNPIVIISAITKRALSNLNITVGSQVFAQIKSVAVIN